MTTTLNDHPQFRAELDKLLQRVDFDETIRQRAVQDSLSTVHAWQLRRRADLFDAARPRPDDFTGAATPDEIAKLDERMVGAARALRQKALLLERGLLDD